MRNPKALLLSLVVVSPAIAAVTVDVHRIDGDGVQNRIGTVTVAASPYGAVLKPALSGLEPGLHGFHLHKNPACGPGKKGEQKKAGLAAGGHFDPGNTGKHRGPYEASGHLGDLPTLYVDSEGKASVPVLAPRLKPGDFNGHALVIHAGGDNYSDEPKKLGGGGARVACAALP